MGFAGVVAVLICGAQTPNVPRNTPPATNPAPAASPPSTTPMDQPVRLLAEAKQSFQGVRDYTCLFIKRERLRGQLQADNLIEMKVRNQPFSVYLRWLGPKPFEGQEACYVAGRNNNMMRVHSTGLASVAGFVSVDLRDPRVMQNSRHTINEAGIGNLIGRLSQRWDYERNLNKTQVQIADYTYNQRPCTRVELLHPDRAAGNFNAFRSVVYFDKASHLPIRIENYDWPQAGAAATGDLLESYSYVNLRANVGLSDADFNR
jgi:hypothetical protein